MYFKYVFFVITLFFFTFITTAKSVPINDDRNEDVKVTLDDKLTEVNNGGVKNENKTEQSKIDAKELTQDANTGVIVSYSDDFGEFPFALPDNATVMDTEVGVSYATGTEESMEITTSSGKEEGVHRANFEGSCFSGYERAADGSCQEVFYD